MKSATLLLTIVPCIALTLTHTLRAAEKAKDGFEGGKEGSSLSGHKTETGELRWEASENVLVRREKGESSLSLSNTHGFVARLPMKSDFSMAIIEAEVRPSNASSESDPWIAVGFGGGAIVPGALNVTWPRGIFLLVSSKGWYQCMLNPSKSGGDNLVQLLGGSVEKFSPEDYVPLRLEYDKAQNKVTMSVNGQIVLKEYKLEDNGFTPDVSFAGISGYSQVPNVSSVDNVILTVRGKE